MRILIHSNAPWVPSGYGRQARLAGYALRELGHEVAYSAFSGLSGSHLQWEGFEVLPNGLLPYGNDMIIGHAMHWGADLVLCIMDFWNLAPIAEQLRDAFQVAAWLPIDSTPLDKFTREMLARSGAVPIAMSPHGTEQLAEAGHPDAIYVPHAHNISTEVYAQAAEHRARYREGMGLQDNFLIGICAANSDLFRKGWAEQFEAFRRFQREHEEARLVVHTMAKVGGALDLNEMAADLRMIPGTFSIADSYPQLAGIFDDEFMVDFFSTLDVLSSCSLAEGFGVPMIEAQACGTPVISTNGTAMKYTNSHGWQGALEPFWNHHHGAWWDKPTISGIKKAYDKAHRYAGSRRESSRAFSEAFHIDAVAQEYWKAALERLEATK